LRDGSARRREAPVNDTSEEKSLPASRKKLDDARKKGQVAKSQDLVAAVCLLAATLYVVMAYPGFAAQLDELFRVSERVYAEPFSALAPRLIELAVTILLDVMVPLLSVVSFAAILTNLVTMGGPVFSFETVKPKFDNVNPASGFKRVFSMRSVIEFLKALFKVAALAIAFIVVFRLGINAMMQAPACGLPCVYDTAIAVMEPLVITAIIVFLIVGLVDVLLQRQLFMREMRMTKTESKREHKDMEGAPEIKRERRRLSQEMSSGTIKLGLKNASILIGKPGVAVVGLRFVRGETPVPTLVCRAQGTPANVLMTGANLLGIPVVSDGALAKAILADAALGDPVPNDLFQPVADILVAAKLV
jgi:type III secretion protein U